MVEKVGFLFADVGVFDGLVYLHRFCFDPLAVFPVASVLGDLPDVDLGVEVGGKGFAMFAGVTVDNVEGMDLIKIVLSAIGCKHTGYTGVEATTQDGHDTGFPEAVLVGPLPAVFELSHIPRLVIGRVEIVGFGFQAGIHDSEVLVRQCYVDDQVWFKFVDQAHQFRHVVGIYLCGFHTVAADVACDAVTFFQGAAGQHNVGKHLRHPGALACHHVTYSAGTNDQYFAHTCYVL